MSVAIKQKSVKKFPYAQLAQLISNALQTFVAVNYQQTLGRQETQHRISKTIVVTGRIICIKTELRCQFSQENLNRGNRRSGKNEVRIRQVMDGVFRDQIRLRGIGVQQINCAQLSHRWKA